MIRDRNIVRFVLCLSRIRGRSVVGVYRLVLTVKSLRFSV